MTETHILSVLVENKPGVLSRITGLFSRRGFNIESLAVAPTEDPLVSRLTAVVVADDVSFEQICKQLNKLVSVIKINAFPNGTGLVRELMMVKVDVEPERRNEIIEIATIFHAKIIDVGAHSLTLEITGTDDKFDGIEALLRPYGIQEITRTGKIAVSRASKE